MRCSRRNFMVPVSRIATIEAPNEYLEHDLEAMATLPATLFGACHQGLGHLRRGEREVAEILREAHPRCPVRRAEFRIVGFARRNDVLDVRVGRGSGWSSRNPRSRITPDLGPDGNERAGGSHPYSSTPPE